MHKKAYQEAETILNGAIAKFDQNEGLHYNLAVLLEKMGRYDEMISHLRKAIELNPKNAETLNFLGYFYADKNMNLDEAFSLIKSALELKPDSGFILDSLGWVYYRQGKYDNALEIIKKAADLTNDDPVVLEHLGDVYNALHNPERAIEFWEKALMQQEKEEGLKERVEKKIKEIEPLQKNR
jgi:tetratricopeptide (TPR) repeat protein